MKDRRAMKQAVQDLQRLIEAALLAHLPQCRLAGAKPLDDALHYVMFPGGKRLRPMLAMTGARIFVTDPRPALGAACAVEYIHASSLIFDDLPCMDDAAIRRGLPVVHKVFGEEVAWLAGIALLNQAYALFGKVPALIAEATYCIGVEGMIGGQALDLAPHGGDETALLERSRNLAERNRKTSAMMRLALTAGALACGVSADDVAPLGHAGHCLGEAYQIGDDLMDARRSSDAMGKPAGQDQRHHRPSHGLHDHEASFDQLHRLIDEARDTLTRAYGAGASELLASIDLIFNAQIMEASQVS
jgi:geranylgeranyl diphosphate synthase type II